MRAHARPRQLLDEARREPQFEALRLERSMNKFNHRLKKLEQRFLPSDDGTCTLEELCRAMWLQDKRRFLEIAKNTSFSLYARQFEYDDAERGGAVQIRRRE